LFLLDDLAFGCIRLHREKHPSAGSMRTLGIITGSNASI
jgi:hypothetical protein